MIVCLILGMGIPTIPNYIITSSIAEPALLKLGASLIVSHMFVFYFCIMADLTRPVALAAFAAALLVAAVPFTDELGFALAAVLPLSQFTLAWTHSIEKIRREENYRVRGERLVLEEARIRGSGAGMEPPAGAQFKNGIWRYRPALPALERLNLTHSPYTSGYEICGTSACQALSTVLVRLPEFASIEIRACRQLQ